MPPSESKDAKRAERRTRPPAPDPLPIAVPDAHCHLDVAGPAAGGPLPVAEALSMAEAVGVNRIVQVGCDLAGSEWAARTAQAYDPIIAGVALHPNEAPDLAERGELEAALGRIEELAGDPSGRVRIVGETGMDFYRTGPEGVAAQEESFRAHIEIAKRHDRTLMIHDRDAHEAIVEILDDAGWPDRVVMHCFSGDAEFARRCLDSGAWLSFAGVVTFKNAAPLRDALAITGIDRVLVETDAPYLTPEPFRGRPNVSYLIPYTVRSMAQTLNTSVPELCEALNANADAAFGSW